MSLETKDLDVLKFRILYHAGTGSSLDESSIPAPPLHHFERQLNMSKMSAVEQSVSRCPKPPSKLSIDLPEDEVWGVTAEEPLMTDHAPKSLSTRNRNLQPVSSSQFNKPGTRGSMNSPKAKVVFNFADSHVKPRPPMEPKTCLARSPNRYIFSTQSNAKVLTTVKTHSAQSPRHAKVVIHAKAEGQKTVLNGLVSQVQPTTNDGSSISKSEVAYKEHLFQTFQALKFVQQIKPADYDQIRDRMVLLAKRPNCQAKKTVVFDLDETLVHCVEDLEQAHVVIPVVFPSGESIRAGVNIRPFAKECLTAANRLYEVMVFTASHKCYADRVLDYLDPTGELIHHRLYRDSCIVTDGVYIKDLRVLANRRLQDVVIVDNAAYSFAYQLDNGVPIISWFDDMRDRELFNLVEYLKALAQAEDIRVVNRKTFHLNRFYEDYQRQFLEDKENTTSQK